jgi:hypothetical protein
VTARYIEVASTHALPFTAGRRVADLVLAADAP